MLAFLTGSVLAVVLFVPFVFVNYGRHGKLSGTRLTDEVTYAATEQNRVGTGA